MLGILRPRLVALRNSSKLHTVSLGFVQIGIYICVVLIIQEDRFYSERGLGAATSNKAFEMKGTDGKWWVSTRVSRDLWFVKVVIAHLKWQQLA